MDPKSEYIFNQLRSTHIILQKFNTYIAFCVRAYTTLKTLLFAIARIQLETRLEAKEC